MAKIIRQVKLTEEDILKNSGKDISHSILKQKKKERMYTSIMAIIFIITIPLAIFLSFRVDTHQLFESSYYKETNIVLTHQFITLDKNNILSDEEALKKDPYIIKYYNQTSQNINYIIHFAKDEKAIDKCKCNDKLIDYHHLKYSIDGKTVNSFSDDTMLITANMIRSRKKDQFKLWIWIDDTIKENDISFLGKVVFEELEDMDV